MIYPMADPPFEIDSFQALTAAQARRHFEWYISSIPERVSLLQECFNSVWRCRLTFDYSLESLGPLWNAFEKHMRTEKRSEKQIRAENAGAPEYVIEEMLRDRRYPTTGTYIIALDIAMYFGEVLARHLPGIYWGFFTRAKKTASVNCPVLLGFAHRMNLDPTRIVIVGCRRSIEKRNPRFLSEVVEVWKGYLPQDQVA